jgi:hypothetical protein
LFVVSAIFVSACVAGYEATLRLLDPREPDALVALALAGLVGYAGNLVAAHIRTRAGRRLHSPALIADGDHARADAYVSLAVVASAATVALGVRSPTRSSAWPSPWSSCASPGTPGRPCAAPTITERERRVERSRRPGCASLRSLRLSFLP